MKTSIILALFLSLSFCAPQAHAQMVKKQRRTSTSISLTDTNAIQAAESSGMQQNGIASSAPGDPYNVNHPFFQGSQRWSSKDSLYTHGDFPWALVSQHPEDFTFDPTTGKWEVSSTANLGKSR